MMNTGRCSISFVATSKVPSQVIPAYLKIHNLGASDKNIFDKYNRTPEFWRLYAHALQTTFFISYGRIFDKRTDAHSIQDVIEATIEHPGFFSKAALRERKRVLTNSSDWIEGYMANAWEPSRKDLELLRDALVPHAEKFKQVYQPIRHSYFAHRGKKTDKDIHAMFGETNIGDVTETLKFLYTFISAIQEMYHNGTKLNLDDVHEYESYVRNLEEQIERLIRSLT
jgi:hypothetical protein